ncbi:hypothetical protein [Streptomyces sp. NPDC001828]|uniref:hypothetical protein n=1 Tax=Streptomyces sp. NPDC001828 TaxID=3364615 RepID=UPI0036D1EA13
MTSSSTRTFPTLRTSSAPVPQGAPLWNPQRPSAMPHHRYRPAHERVALPLTDRTVDSVQGLPRTPPPSDRTAPRSPMPNAGWAR